MNWKRFAMVLGYFQAAGIFIIMFIVFLVAYLNDFKVGVYINEYGEAHVEWFMICIIFDVVLIGGWYMLKELKKK